MLICLTAFTRVHALTAHQDMAPVLLVVVAQTHTTMPLTTPLHPPPPLPPAPPADNTSPLLYLCVLHTVFCVPRSVAVRIHKNNHFSGMSSLVRHACSALQDTTVLWLIETHGHTCIHCGSDVSCDVLVSALEDAHVCGSGRVVLRYTSDHTLNHTSADTITHIGVTDSTGS